MRRVRRPRTLAAGLAALLTAGLASTTAQAAAPTEPATTSVPVQLVSITDFHGYLRRRRRPTAGPSPGPTATLRSSAERRTWRRI